MYAVCLNTDMKYLTAQNEVYHKMALML